MVNLINRRTNFELIPCEGCGQPIKKVGPRRWCASCGDVERTNRLADRGFRQKRMANKLKNSQTLGESHGSSGSGVSSKI